MVLGERVLGCGGGRWLHFKGLLFQGDVDAKIIDHCTLWFGALGNVVPLIQVPFATAKSNVATYLEAAHLNNLAASLPVNADKWATLFSSALSFTIVLIWQRSNAHYQSLRNEYLFLKDAAQFVYDETRHTVLAKIARDEHINDSGDPLMFVAKAILHRSEHLEGKFKGATRYDPIPPSEKEHLWTDAKIADAGPMFGPVKYFAMRSRRKILDDVIGYFNRLNIAKL